MFVCFFKFALSTRANLKVNSSSFKPQIVTLSLLKAWWFIVLWGHCNKN